MKKKSTITFVVIIILLAGTFIYFRPLSLNNLLDEGNQILVTLTEMGVKDGAAINNSKDYSDITAESKMALLELLNQYSYRRTFTTLFSDGSIQDGGGRVLYIFVYEGTLLTDGIFVTPSGQISVNHKNYKMRNADDFIEQVLSIIEA